MVKFIKFIISTIFLLIYCTGISFSQSNSTKQSIQQSTLESLVGRADKVIEGRVIKKNFLIDKDSVIYTSVIIRVSKIFKGIDVDSNIEIVYPGGFYAGISIPYQFRSNGFTITTDDEGVFFLKINNTNIKINRVSQSFLPAYGRKSVIHYFNDHANPTAACFNVAYYDLEKEVFQPIEGITRQKRIVLGANIFERQEAMRIQK